MKRHILLCIFCTLLFTIPFVAAGSAQETVTISLEDLKQFRKMAADRDYWKGVADDRQAQIDAAQKSNENWRKIAASETDRADRVQGGRVTEVKAANTDFKEAIDLFKTSQAADRQKIGEQNAEIISLKSSRKWYFFTGTALGAVAGGYIGRQTCSNGFIPTFLTQSADQAKAISQAKFGMTLKF